MIRPRTPLLVMKMVLACHWAQDISPLPKQRCLIIIRLIMMVAREL